MTKSIWSRLASDRANASPKHDDKGHQSHRCSFTRQWGQSLEGAGSRPKQYGQGFPAADRADRCKLKQVEMEDVLVERTNVSPTSRTKMPASVSLLALEMSLATLRG